MNFTAAVKSAVRKAKCLPHYVLLNLYSEKVFAAQIL